MIQKWELGDDATSWNDNLREAPFYSKPKRLRSSISSLQHFGTSLSAASPRCPIACSSLSDIFNNMIPAVHGNSEADVNAQEKHIVSPGLIGHLKCQWLIYTAAFKDPFEASQYLALLRLRSKSDRRRSAPLDDPDSEGQDERAHPGPAADGNGAGGLVVATVVPLVNEWMNL